MNLLKCIHANVILNIKLIASCFILLLSSAVYSQAPLVDIEGDAKVLGRLDIQRSASNVSTHIGTNAGKVDTFNRGNVFIGHSSGLNNTGGFHNTFVGLQTGETNINGFRNVFIGTFSGENNTGGDDNIFVGAFSGNRNDHGAFNTFVGSLSGPNNTEGNDNVFVGTEAGRENIQGQSNTFIGRSAGKDNTTGSTNVYIGARSAESSIEGTRNTFIGTESGMNHESSLENLFIGHKSGFSMTTGTNNTLIGHFTGENLALGFHNVVLGDRAGREQQDCIQSVLLGAGSGQNYIKGDGNIFIGFKTGFSSGIDSLRHSGAIGYKAEVSCSDCLNIGNATSKIGIRTPEPKAALHIKQRAQNDTGGLRLQRSDDLNDWDMYVSSNSSSLVFEFDQTAIGAFIRGTDGSYNILSDRRLKSNIKDMDDVLSRILQLEPKIYTLVTDPSAEEKIGFIAQQVQALFPIAVHQEDEYLSINYDNFSVLAIQAIKELVEDRTKDKDRIAALEADVQRLFRLLDK